MSNRFRRRAQPSQFAVPHAKRTGPPPGPEILPWYWHPDRMGAQPAPASFQAQLKAINPDLGVVFSPVHERWLIWVKEPRIQHPICRGWKLLYLWEDPTTHAFLPLSELVFHNLMLIDSRRFANAAEYYDRIQASVERAKEARCNDYTRERQAEQGELATMHQISNISPGSRSALHQDGTIIPSQGHQNWLNETRKWRLPPEMLKQEADDKEKRFYGR